MTLARTLRQADHNQKWLNWILATGGAPVGSSLARRIYNRTAARASYMDGVPLPTTCQLPPTAFANGERLRFSGMLPLDTCMCHGGSGMATRCEARRELLCRPFVVAHFNFALSASHKTCMAKAIGGWLLSDERAHRSGYYTSEATRSLVEQARSWVLLETRASTTSVVSGRSHGRSGGGVDGLSGSLDFSEQEGAVERHGRQLALG